MDHSINWNLVYGTQVRRFIAEDGFREIKETERVNDYDDDDTDVIRLNRHNKNRQRSTKLLFSHSCRRIPGILYRYLNNPRMITKRFSLLLVLGLTGLGIFYVTLTNRISTHSTRPNRIQEGPFKGYRDCMPANKVAFMKTHKCASTSIQNILMRYGLNHDLNFVLPLTGHYLGKQVPFDRSMLKGTLWHEANMSYNIFCQHTRWNQKEVSAVLGLDVRYISIVRDPVELFRSLWDYGNMGQVLGISLENYALMKEKTGPYADRVKTGNLGQNQMLWDFGLDHSLLTNESAIRAKIFEIESNFDLVMVAERFDESIVLLRDELCWSYRDVTSLKLNARNKTKESHISDEARAALKEWLRGDYMLYEHFAERFSERVEQYGLKRMNQELRVLRHANQNLLNRCVDKQVESHNLPDSQQLWGKNLIGYQLKNDNDTLCHYLTLKEVSFVNELRSVQSKRASEVLENRNSDSHLPPTLNPKMFEMQMKAGGMPDIEAMKQIFPFKGP